jgi:tRNA (mo5U34)-methyltransferase
LNSKIDFLDIDLPELSIGSVGQFDVVLFLGVLYHLKDPMVQLERLIPLAKEVFVIETVTSLNEFDFSVVQYFDGSSLGNDSTNYFGFNMRALKSMLNDLGYSNISIPELSCEGWCNAVIHVWK